LRRNNALRPDRLADKTMIAFAIELGIGQHPAKGKARSHFIQQRTEGGAVIDRPDVLLARESNAHPYR
jgi:hypothetical protein